MLITEWDDDEYREVLLEEGMERGREQGRIDIARRLKAEGAKSALIVKVTGLSEKDIAVL